MKKHNFILLITSFLFILSANGQFTVSPWLQNPTRADFKIMNYQTEQSKIFAFSNLKMERDGVGFSVLKKKKMRGLTIGGMIAAGVGAALLITGVVMVNSANSQATTENYLYGYTSDETIVKQAVGSALALGGTIFFIGGGAMISIPLISQMTRR